MTLNDIIYTKFEKVIESKYKRNYTEEEIYSLISQKKLFNDYNIIVSGGFTSNIDLYTFIQDTDITPELIQALTYIDYTLKPEEVIKQIESIPQLEAKIKKDVLLQTLKDNYKDILRISDEMLYKYPELSPIGYDYMTSLRSLKNFLKEEPPESKKENSKNKSNNIIENIFSSLTGGKEDTKTTEGSLTKEIENKKDSLFSSLASYIGLSSTDGISDVISKGQDTLKSISSGDISAITKNDTITSLLGKDTGGMLNSISEVVSSKQENLTSSLMKMASENLGLSQEIINETGTILETGSLDNISSNLLKSESVKNIVSKVPGGNLISEKSTELLSGLTMGKNPTETISTLIENNKSSENIISQLKDITGSDPLGEITQKISKQENLVADVGKMVGEVESLKNEISNLKESSLLDSTKSIKNKSESLTSSDVKYESSKDITSDIVKGSKKISESLPQLGSLQESIPVIEKLPNTISQLPIFGLIGRKG